MNIHLQECIPYWEEHNNMLSKLIDSADFFSIKRDSVLIIGAGNCYDIPLFHLLEQYEEVNLFDIDKETIEETKSKFSHEFQTKIHLIHDDIAGLPLITMQEIINLLNIDIDQAYLLMLSLNNNMASYNPKFNNLASSLIISSTVTSQIAFPFVKAIENSFNNELINEAKKFEQIIVEKHVKLLWDTVKSNNGISIITSEQYAWGYSNNGEPFLLTNLLDEPKDMLRKDVQIYIENNKGKLTINGRIDRELIEKYIPKKSIISERQWIWKFSENVHYLVKGWLVTY